MEIEFRLLILIILGLVGVFSTFLVIPLLLKEYNKWNKFCIEEKDNQSGIFYFIFKKIIMILKTGLILLIPFTCYAGIWLGVIIFTLFLLNNDNVSNIRFYIPYLVTLLIGVSLLIFSFYTYVKKNKDQEVKLLFWKEELNIFLTNDNNDNIKIFKSYIWLVKTHWLLIYPISILLSICELIGNLLV
jgi:hypothetical protein